MKMKVNENIPPFIVPARGKYRDLSNGLGMI